jgi:hypothetical protein
VKWLIGSIVALASGVFMAFLFLVVHVGPQAQSLSPTWLAGIVVLGVFMGVIAVAAGGVTTPGAGKPVRVASGAVLCALSALLFGMSWNGVWVAGLAGAALGYAGMKWVEHV